MLHDRDRGRCRWHCPHPFLARTEVRAAEIRAAEIRVAEVRAAEIHVAEVRAAEIRARCAGAIHRLQDVRSFARPDDGPSESVLDFDRVFHGSFRALP